MSTVAINGFTSCSTAVMRQRSSEEGTSQTTKQSHADMRRKDRKQIAMTRSYRAGEGKCIKDVHLDLRSNIKK